MNIRHQCVLCDNSQLIKFAEIFSTIYVCVPIGSDDKIIELDYGYCENCFSVQLMKLADPTILYDKNYFQPLNNTWLWIQHNIAFTKFIIDNLNTDTNNSIIEIGSSSFCLGKHLIHYYTDYTIFDYSTEQAIKRDGITYIEGNCETYDFTPNSNIVMSHVFEHLYDPKLFINNCSKNNVRNVFIAIPDMSSSDILHVESQHTFMYSASDIEYIFGRNKYKLNDKLIWNSKDLSFACLFYHFVLTNEVLEIPRQINENRHLYAIQFLTTPIDVPTNTFIATAGMYSIILYQKIRNKNDVIGIIDLDKNKVGKKFSNTELIVYSYEHLTYKNDYNILVKHPKKINIIDTIRQYNDSINIICL